MPKQKKAPATPAAKKQRKAYPSLEERIVLADAKIAQLEKLNASREALVAKTAATLAERQAALQKSQEALEKVRQRKERLLIAKDQPASAPRSRKKAAADPQYLQLMEALKASGKSLDELLAELKK